MWSKASALELAHLLEKREVSSEELTRYYLQRIERWNPQFQAFTSVLWHRAIWAARQKDKERAKAKGNLPRLHGVPTAIKDLVPVRGTRTRLGSRAFKYFISPIDAPLAKNVKAAGLINLGKLATSEFGAMPVTETDVHPPVRNPFDERCTAGGSSGGSGAAVAADMIPFAHGSDGAGSVRIPSALCHLYGFKPSLSLLGNLHGPINDLGLSVMGPLAHTVLDAAILLDAFRGDGRESCLDAARSAPKKLKIRVSKTPPLGEVDPQIAEAVDATAKTFESLGHHVEEADTVTGDLDEFLPLWFYMLSRVPSPSERPLQPITKWLRRSGKGLASADMLAKRDELASRVATVFGDADIMLTPTIGKTAPRIADHKDLAPDEAFRHIAPLGAFTAVFNISGQPAASIPAGVSKEGLPFAVQLVGKKDDDHTVLSVSRQLEQAMPWRDRDLYL